MAGINVKSISKAFTHAKGEDNLWILVIITWRARQRLYFARVATSGHRSYHDLR